MQPTSLRPLAVVTGASSGIGFELARECAANGFDLVIAADRPLDRAANELCSLGASVDRMQVDLSTLDGVNDLYIALRGRSIDALLANAGHGLGKGFLDQNFVEAKHVVDTNIIGTIYLIHKIGNDMRDRGRGRILITGSIAGFMPGVTDTDFFKRADLMDTKVGTEENKMDPAEVARIGFKAMMDGDGDVIAGLRNKLKVAVASVTPSSILAEQHRRTAEPGSAANSDL